jgi:hypothetical protein
VRILVTISDMIRVGIILDLKSGKMSSIPVRPEFIDRDPDGAFPCRPFGITWSSDELYIANHRQLLVFNRELKFLRIVTPPLQVNIHQLAYNSGCVWAVSPRTNSLIGVYPGANATAVEFKLLLQKVIPYTPRQAKESEDKHHFNSLLWADGYLFVAAHNFGYPSFINCYEEATLYLEYTQCNVGFSVHGLAIYKGELFWISTQTSQVRSNQGYSQQLLKQGYGRGFAMTDQYFIVAISEFLHRDKRRSGDSWIQVIDRQHKTVVAEFHLYNTGSISDLRLLDTYDYAHCIDPFWSSADLPGR